MQAAANVALSALGSRGTRGFPEESPRFGEVGKLLPVALVFGLIVVVYFEFVFLHCGRLLQFELPPEARDRRDVRTAVEELVVFHGITGILLYCFAACILVQPGTIPDGQGWELRPDVESDRNLGSTHRAVIEMKHSGERRHCKWCLKYKPDRTHHCRVCNQCVVRMDHHCPFVYNCIGFRNYKYFFLLLVYAVLDLLFVNFTMFESVWWSTRTDVNVFTMLMLTFGETLVTFLAAVTTCFLAFHCWLVAKAMTTLEFFEKSLKCTGYDDSIYSRGVYENICSVLGPQPLLWLLPVSHPEGAGLNFSSFAGSSDRKSVV